MTIAIDPQPTLATVSVPAAPTDSGPLEDRVLAYANAKTSAGIAIHLTDATRACGGKEKATAKAIASLCDQGKLQRMIGNGGWVSTSAPHHKFVSQSLATLLKHAGEHTDPTHAPPKGRKANDLNREIWVLSTAQWHDIQRMAALVAARLPGIHGNLYRVTGSLMAWDADARDGRGEWKLVEVVRTLTREQHREKYEARRGVDSWKPDLAEESVTKNVAAAQNLMYLAATYGLIDRATTMDPGGPYLYAPVWIPTLERFIRWMSRRAGSKNPPRVTVGARVLATYATKLGGTSLRDTDWLAVRDRILADGATGVLPNHKMIAARWVWRALIRYLPRSGDEYAWPLKTVNAVMLVGSRAIAAAIEPATPTKQRDFSAWKLPDGRFAVGLIEGSYGLRRWAEWSTLEDLQLSLAEPALPRREWHWDSTLVTRRKGAAPLRVSEETVRTRLTIFAYLAGFARERGVDWADPATPGLLVLAKPEFVREFMRWTLSLPTDSRGNRHCQLSQRVRTLSWLVNGFLAGQAKLEEDAERFRELESWYRRLEEACAQLPVPEHLNRGAVAARVLATADGWKGADGVEGLRKLERLL